jgi:ABC-type Mn2+/Zn2+ transport system ATPase subunit
MSPLISMRDVTVGYVADIDILRGVNIDVKPGAITGLIGLNGAGKSIITIRGFLRPHAGTMSSMAPTPARSRPIA